MDVRRSTERPLVIGHRGAAAVASENTLEGLEAGLASGADLVEFDIGNGLRLGHSLTETAADAPSLLDALLLVRERGKGAHIDLKAAGIEDAVVSAVRRMGMDEAVVISTNSTGAARRLAVIAPRIVHAIGYPQDRHGVADAPWPGSLVRAGAASLRAAMPLRARALLAASNANGLSLHHALVSSSVVKLTAARGIPLYAWTVNDPDRVRALARLGVDGIISDDPAMALKALAE